VARQEYFIAAYRQARQDDAVNWSWVATADLVAERRDHARELVGSRLSAVVTRDSRAGNVVWLLSVGGRAYAGRNGDLQESC
jgi:hypothetical protein